MLVWPYRGSKKTTSVPTSNNVVSAYARNPANDRQPHDGDILWELQLQQTVMCTTGCNDSPGWVARFQISLTELGICSSGACITTITEPTMHDTHPSTPSFSSRSLSTKCANTELPNSRKNSMSSKEDRRTAYLSGTSLWYGMKIHLTIMLNAPSGVTSTAGANM